MADATPNPFAALLPSPEGLDVQRRQQFLDLSQGQDYFSRVAGLSGLDFRKELINRGIGLTDEDRRAFNTQAILSRAQKSLSDMVKSGEMDPLSAQAEVIKRTMADFMAMGDYRAAQALLPGLNQIQTYQGEIAKVKSYTGAQDASAYKDTAAGVKSYADVAATGERLPSEIDAKRAEAEYNRQRVETERHRAGLLDAQAQAALRGPETKPQNPTEANRAAEGYRARMENAESLLPSINYNIGSGRAKVEYRAATQLYAGENPTLALASNSILSPEAQQYYQAVADWIRAKLRKESGATISKSEWDGEVKTYFPIPGDPPALVAQKNKARKQAAISMKVAAGPALGLADQFKESSGEWSVVK